MRLRRSMLVKLRLSRKIARANLILLRRPKIKLKQPKLRSKPIRLLFKMPQLNKNLRVMSFNRPKNKTWLPVQDLLLLSQQS